MAPRSRQHALFTGREYWQAEKPSRSGNENDRNQSISRIIVYGHSGHWPALLRAAAFRAARVLPVSDCPRLAGSGCPAAQNAAAPRVADNIDRNHCGDPGGRIVGGLGVWQAWALAVSQCGTLSGDLC